MIGHLAEVWSLLLVVFLVGCAGGAFLFTSVARSQLASAQWAFANTIGRVEDSLRHRFGMAPVWRARRPPLAATPPIDAAEGAQRTSEPEADAEPVWEVVARAVQSVALAPVPEIELQFQPELAPEPQPEPKLTLGPGPRVDEEQTHEPIDLDALLAIAMQREEPPREIVSPQVPDVLADEPLQDQAPEESPPPLIRPIFPPSIDELPPPPRALPPRRLPRPPLAPLSPIIPQPEVLPSPAAPVPLLTARDDSDPPASAAEIRRPATLVEPRNGVPDNLRRIKGIGDRNEVQLNKLGIFHFSQIAAWTPAEVRWIGLQLAFPERIERDDWVGQAIVLATGGNTGFTKSVERRRARRRNGRDGDETDLD